MASDTLELGLQMFVSQIALCVLLSVSQFVLGSEEAGYRGEEAGFRGEAMWS